MSYSVLQLGSTLKNPIVPSGNFIYNNVPVSSQNVTYNSSTGEITIHAAGTYLFNWNLSFSAAAPGTPVRFALMQGMIAYNSTVLLKNSQLTGTALIEVDYGEAPVIVSLVNTGTTCYFSNELTETGTMTVTKVDSETIMECFSYQQMVHVLEQLVTLYPTQNWSVFIASLYSYTGLNGGLYTGTAGIQPGLLVITDGTEEVRIPITRITAIYIGDDAVYNSAITYLPAPDPYPQDCYAQIMAAIASYAPVGTEDVNILLGINTVASGLVYENQTGMLILAEPDGSTPLFIPVLMIQQINKPLVDDARRAAGVQITNQNP